MSTTATSTILAACAAAFATVGGCTPRPPEAEPPEIEVSGGELPEYDTGEEAELEQRRRDDLALDVDPNDDDDDDDFDDDVPFLR